MRALLLLAWLLYDVVYATKYYDYDDTDIDKRHNQKEERRNWRKKVLLQNTMDDHKDWTDDQRKNDYDAARYYRIDTDRDNAAMEYKHDPMVTKSAEARYDKMQNRYDKEQARYDKDGLSVETKRTDKVGKYSYLDKEADKSPMNCDRSRERYEGCFAGCAAVSCDNPRERLRPCYPFCESGCICIPPYVRDDRTHKCVLVEECTKGLKGIPDLGDNEDI